MNPGDSSEEHSGEFISSGWSWLIGPGALDKVLCVCSFLLFIEELEHLVDFKTHYWMNELKTNTNETPAIQLND